MTKSLILKVWEKHFDEKFENPKNTNTLAKEITILISMTMAKHSELKKIQRKTKNRKLTIVDISVSTKLQIEAAPLGNLPIL